MAVHVTASCFGLGLALLGAGPAAAGPETLQRSLQNVAFAPVDFTLAPVVAGRSIARGLESEDDPIAVRVAFAGPGIVWNTGVQALASVVRGLAGVLELPPGIALCFSDADLAPLYDPAEHGPALVDVETRALHVRIGVDYVAP